MSPDEKWRNKARGALVRYFRSRSAPRLALSLVMLLTGGVGWLISYALLRAGMYQMWLRYPLAVLLGYGFFLGLLRLWVELEMRRFDFGALETRDAEKYGPPIDSPMPSKESSWLDWLDFSPDLDFDSEGCALLLLFGALLAVAVAFISAVMGAPSLIAEVFLDAFLMAGLFRRLRRARREHWLGTAVRKTWSTAVIVAIGLSIAGVSLEWLAPGAHSIGPAVQRLRGVKTEDGLLEKP